MTLADELRPFVPEIREAAANEEAIRKVAELCEIEIPEHYADDPR